MGALANFRQLVNGLTGAIIRLAAHGARRSAPVEDIAWHRDRLRELTAAKENAERANEAKSEFLAKMSQEMRIPLTALLRYSDMLLARAELEGRTEQLADLRKISAAGQHVLGMVHDILDISRIEAGEVALQLENRSESVALEPALPAVLHRGPSADEQAFLDEIDAETSASGSALPDTSPLADSDQQRLLVVDDDRDFLDLAELLLLDQGYTPVCTDAPQSALQIARTVKPVAIFLDTMMPGFDGWDVLAALKSDPETAAIPVFMTSVLSERSKALAAGAEGVVSKPLDAATLKAAMTGLKTSRGSGTPVARAVGG